MKRQCKMCGRSIEGLSGRRKLCDECAQISAGVLRVPRSDTLPAKPRRRKSAAYADLPESAIISGQSLQLCRDVHNAILSGRSYGVYMGMRDIILSRNKAQEDKHGH